MDVDSPDNIRDFLAQISNLKSVASSPSSPSNARSTITSSSSAPSRTVTEVLSKETIVNSTAASTIVGSKASEVLEPIQEEQPTPQQEGTIAQAEEAPRRTSPVRKASLEKPKETPLPIRSRASTLAESHESHSSPLSTGAVAPPPTPQTRAAHHEETIDEEGLVGLHISEQLERSCMRDLAGSTHASPGVSNRPAIQTRAIGEMDSEAAKAEALTTSDFGALFSDMTSFLNKRGHGSTTGPQDDQSHGVQGEGMSDGPQEHQSSAVEWDAATVQNSATEVETSPHDEWIAKDEQLPQTEESQIDKPVSNGLVNGSSNGRHVSMKQAEDEPSSSTASQASAMHNTQAADKKENSISGKLSFDPKAAEFQQTPSMVSFEQAIEASEHAFKRWPIPGHRTGPPAVPRSVRISRLPFGAQAHLVASLVFGGPVESITIGLGGMAKVTFVHGKDRDVYAQATVNGMVWATGSDGKPKYIDVDPIQDVDVVGQKLQSLLEQGATRCVFAIAEKTTKTAEDLKNVRGVSHLKFESVEENQTQGRSEFNFRMCSVNDAVELKKALAMDEEWEVFNAIYYEDPCGLEWGSEERTLKIKSGRPFSIKD